MFKKLLNKIGIGTASVNLVLDADRARVGEDLVGSIMITGGSSETKVDAVNVNLIMKTKQGDSEHEHHVAKIPVVKGLVVGSGENLQFPIRFTLPALPQSSRYVTYSLHTELDIPGAVDKHDFDDFYVLPAQPVAVLQDALHHLGFEPKSDSGEMEGPYQKFEYKPTSGAYKGRLSELEVIFLLEEEGVRLYVELDHKSGYFGKEIESTPTVFIGYGHLNSVESAQAIWTDFLEQEISHVAHGSAHVSHAPHAGHAPHGHHSDHDGPGLGTTLAAAAVGGLVAAAAGAVVEELVEDAIEEALGLDDFQASIDDSVAALEASAAELDAIAANLEDISDDYDQAVADIEDAVEDYEEAVEEFEDTYSDEE